MTTTTKRLDRFSGNGLASTGYKKTAEIILDLKTAKLLSKILHNKWSVNYKVREKFEQYLNDHIEACSK